MPEVVFKPCAHDFNPRPREEGDGLGKKFDELSDISIHALVKRATDIMCIGSVSELFQSTPS